MSSLAAVQADGYYYPPDYDYKKGGLNKVRLDNIVICISLWRMN